MPLCLLCTRIKAHIQALQKANGGKSDLRFFLFYTHLCILKHRRLPSSPSKLIINSNRQMGGGWAVVVFGGGTGQRVGWRVARSGWRRAGNAVVGRGWRGGARVVVGSGVVRGRQGVRERSWWVVRWDCVSTKLRKLNLFYWLLPVKNKNSTMTSVAMDLRSRRSSSLCWLVNEAL